MKAVIQRVLNANLKVDGELISEIGAGYVIFLGVKKGDTKETADYFIKKIPPLRICEDENGKINKSIVDTNGVIGLEMAAYYAAVGSQVTVVEMLDHMVVPLKFFFLKR